MKIFVALLLLLLSCNEWQQLHAAKILCIVTTAEHNKPSWTQPFFEALAGRGHSLTILGTSTDPEIKGINHISIENNYDVIKKQYVDKDGKFKQHWDLQQMLIWNEALLGNCRSVVENNLKNNFVAELASKYDLIIYDATYSMECLISMLPNYKDTPVMALSSGKLTVDLLKLMQAEDTINPARIPHFISRLPVDMSYWQRIQNHLLYLGDRFIKWGVVRPVLNGMLRNGFKNPNVQLMLLNTHPVLDYVQSLPPNIIEVGGLHIRAESAPLPVNLKEFIENFPEGIVYINLPHIQLISDEGMKAIQFMIKDFSQFGFIWNVPNKHVSGKYDNLKTINIDLQQDILAQSNLKAFLTHGDSFGLQEAIYNAIPVIVLPILMDQINNAKRIEERVLGIRLTTEELIGPSFSDALKRIVREDIFIKKIQQAQVNFRTRPENPLNQAIWYAEQLASEPKLFKHLPKSVEQNFFVRNSLDFWILPVLFVIFFIGNLVNMFIPRRPVLNKKQKKEAKGEDWEKINANDKTKDMVKRRKEKRKLNKD